MTKKMFAAGGYDFGGTRLQNAADGIGNTDVATVGQLNTAVTAAVSNLDYKGSVRLASTGNVTVSSAPATLDGVSLVSGDRVLLKSQTAATENGIYVFTSASAALVRSTDADANVEVTPGLWVTVEEGTVNADTEWMLTTNAPIVLGTTALTFTKFPLTSGTLTRFAVTGPPSAGTTWAVSHGLGTLDVIAGVRDISTNEDVDFSIVRTDTNTVTITSSASMAQNGYRAVVI